MDGEVKALVGEKDWEARGAAMVAEWQHLHATTKTLTATQRRRWIVKTHIHAKRIFPTKMSVIIDETNVLGQCLAGRSVAHLAPIVRTIAYFCDADTLLSLFSTTRNLRKQGAAIRTDSQIWARLCFLDYGLLLNVLYDGYFIGSGPWNWYLSDMPARPIPTLHGSSSIGWTFNAAFCDGPLPTGVALPKLVCADYAAMRRLFRPSLARVVDEAPRQYREARASNKIAMRCAVVSLFADPVLLMVTWIVVLMMLSAGHPLDGMYALPWLVVSVWFSVIQQCALRPGIQAALASDGPIRLGSSALPTEDWPPRLSYDELGDAADLTYHIVVARIDRLVIFSSVCIEIMALCIIAAINKWFDAPAVFGLVAPWFSGMAAAATVWRSVELMDKEFKANRNLRILVVGVVFSIETIVGSVAALGLVGIISWRIPLAIGMGIFALLAFFVWIQQLLQNHADRVLHVQVSAFCSFLFSCIALVATCVVTCPPWVLLFSLAGICLVRLLTCMNEAVVTWKRVV